MISTVTGLSGTAMAHVTDNVIPVTTDVDNP
jgi:hypothetical protein